MDDTVFTNIPAQYESILEATKRLSFSMASDLQTGSLLKTLVASKPSARILELGTGSGLATSWIFEGMDANATLITIDNNELLQGIAKQHLQDDRIQFIYADGYEWLTSYTEQKFDFIFADSMPGKYDLFEDAWRLLNEHGFYFIDDMLPQLNWTDGHADKVEAFIHQLEKRTDAILTKLNWSTGIIMVTKVDKEQKNGN